MAALPEDRLWPRGEGPKLALDDRSVFEVIVACDAVHDDSPAFLLALRQAQRHVRDGNDPQAYVVVKITRGP